MCVCVSLRTHAILQGFSSFATTLRVFCRESSSSVSSSLVFVICSVAEHTRAGCGRCGDRGFAVSVRVCV